jgi:hypothetical protein
MQPPPHDLAAEEIVLSAVLWSDRTAHELGLLPRQFWGPENQELWAVLLGIEQCECRLNGWDLWWLIAQIYAIPPEPETPGRATYAIAPRLTIRRLLELLRLGALCLRGHELSDPARWQSPEQAAKSIRRTARQRQLIEGMQRVDAALRSGERPSARLLRWTARRLEQMAVDG